MEYKKVMRIAMLVGAVIGGYLPLLWGVSAFSMTSIIFSALGAILGIYIAFKVTH